MEQSTSNVPSLSLPAPAALLTALPPSPAPSTLPAAESFPPVPQDRLANLQLQDDTFTPAMRVRLSLARRVLLAIQGGRRNKTLMLSMAVTFAQLIAWSVVLGLAGNDPCDKPLKLYLILTCVRLGLTLPFSFYSAIVPPRPHRRDPPERIAERELTRQIGSVELDRQIRRVGDLISIFSFIVFVLGNIWVATSHTCRATAPTLFNSALAALVLSWLWTSEVILIVLAVLLFLPFVLIGMRFFGVGTAKHEIGPLSQVEIDKIPQKIFVGSIPEPTATPPCSSSDGDSNKDSNAPTSTVTPAPPSPPSSTSPSQPPTRQFWRLWRLPSKKPSASSQGGLGAGGEGAGEFVALPKGMEAVLLPASQDACSICLMEYEVPPRLHDAGANEWEPEPLKMLPCKHAFHSPCLDSWLLVSGRCPLCQAPVVAKKKGRGGGGADVGSTAADGAAAQV
ncbi:hypothetical protein BCR35DRAFT_298712 [Leucosporidium creatinivorum]|uniref:RING-type domain-containing protein n=1 Tax=Leucosporidium creatinivorum TaxID=106004 RepID=A0A1Y2G406_9BASI|nr:hypothetical protein BCR35DRAFT_298712 [Leucosporidium creatinivorum]